MPNIKPISELELMVELEKGEGCLSADEVEKSLGLKGNMKNKEN